jgi:hypothetical protein
MNRNTLAVGALLVAGFMFINSVASPPAQLVVAEQSTSAATFDYGDGTGTAPSGTLPVVPFTATPPTGPAVGATPVIDGVAAVEAIDNKDSAFKDVPPEPTPTVKEPVASVPPVDLPDAAVPREAVAPTTESAFSDVPPASPAVKGPVASAPAVSGPDWTQNVFPIKCYNSSGCAVAVAPDTLVTVHHVAGYAVAQISTQNQWVNGNVTHPPGADDGLRDGAIVKVPNGQFPSMRVRAPVYYEPVTIYGLSTKIKQRGFVSAARYVSLLPENRGVVSGDSGGAVVADDGCLVGLISGNEGQVLNVPSNPKVVAITRIDYLAPYVPRQAMAATAGDVPLPGGSVFPGKADQPSAFDDVPAVNKNQGASCAAPGNCGTQMQTYYYPQQQQQRRRGLLFFK